MKNMEIYVILRKLGTETKRRMVMKILVKAIRWIVSVFFLMSGLLFFPSISSVLLFLGGILLLPIKGLEERIRGKISPKWVTVAAAVCFIVAAAIAPPTDSSNLVEDPKSSSSSQVQEESSSSSLSRMLTKP